MIAYAKKGDIDRAREFISTNEWNDELNQDDDSDEKAIKLNPGNHGRVIRLIVKAGTEDEVDTLYFDFMSCPHRRKEFEINVFAAYSLKKMLFLPEEDRGQWWFNSTREASKLGYDHTEFLRAAEKLLKKYQGN